jgi:hypothetical protein
VILSNVASSCRSFVSGIDSVSSSSGLSREFDVVVGRRISVFCSMVPVMDRIHG